MSVIDFQQAKEDRQPYISGEARCLGCGFEWQSSAPLEAAQDGLQCPSCETFRGVVKHNYGPDAEVYQCGCGEYVFNVTRTGVFCIACGCETPFADLCDA